MIQKSKGILIVLSGFSGSGKGTIMKELMKKYSEQYALSISATTRSPRPGETDGVEYFFKTKEQFEKMIADDELIEYAKYVDNYYGTPKAYVEEQLAAGKDVILEIEIQGALKDEPKQAENTDVSQGQSQDTERSNNRPRRPSGKEKLSNFLKQNGYDGK